MKSKMKKVYLTALLLVALLGSSFFNEKKAYAEVDTKIEHCNYDSLDESCIAYKSILEDVYQCYVGGGVNTTIKKSTLDYTEKSVYEKIFNKSYKLALPTGFKNTSLNKKDNKPITCFEIAFGKWGYYGLNDISKSFKYNNVNYENLNPQGDPESLKNMFAGFGYTTQEGGGTGKDCFYLEAKRTITEYKFSIWVRGDADDWETKDTKKSDLVCLVKGADGKITSASVSKVTDGLSNLSLSIKEGKIVFTTPVYGTSYTNTPSKTEDIVSLTYKGKTSDALMTELKNNFDKGKTHNQYYHYAEGTTEFNEYVTKIVKTTEAAAADDTEYKLNTANGKKDAAMRAVKSLSGESGQYDTYDKLKFTKQQAAMMLEAYITNENTFDGEVYVPKTNAENEMYKTNSSYTPIKWMTTEGTYNCAYANFPEDKNKNMSVYALINWHFSGSTPFYRDEKVAEEKKVDKKYSVTAELQVVLGSNTCSSFTAETNLDSSDDAKSEFDPEKIISSQAGTDTPGQEDGEEKCRKKYTLGWLVCPIMYGVAEAVDNLEKAIDGFF